MTLSTSRLLQILAVVAQVGNLLLPLTNGKSKAIIAAIIGGVQVILHEFAGNYNPDGTPATVAYQPPEK